MKKFVSIQFLLLLFCLPMFSQTMDVLSFEVLPNDQTARVTDPVYDLNGEKCALIKVVTTEKGYAWEGGILGITEVRDKVGEIWLYIPRGAKKLTIKHDKYGVLRNYIYPNPVKEATVYELILGIDQGNTGKPPKTEWIVINSDPDTADVYIDDEYVGTTPYQQELWEGKHTYLIEKNFYKNRAGSFVIIPSKGRTVLNLKLEANFGQLSVASTPVSEASISIDGRSMEEVTPFTFDQILNGTHILELRKDKYKPKKVQFTIFSDSLTELNVPIEANFGILSIQGPEDCEIYDSDRRVGTGSQNIELGPGVHTIIAKLYRHRDITRKIDVTVGDTAHLTLNFSPETGILAVQTTPFDAEVFVDDKLVGKSPLTIDDLLVGAHKVKISKTGYADILKDINLIADQRIDLREKLVNTKRVQITSDPAGSSIYINGNYVGITPLEHSFNINDKYVVEVKKDSYTDESQTINNINSIGNELLFTLTKKEVPQKVQFTSNPSGAEMYLFGNRMGITPFSMDLSKGKYSIKITKPGYKPAIETFSVDNTTTNKSFTLMEKSLGFGAVYRSTQGLYWGLGYQQTVFDDIQDWGYRIGMNTKLKYTLSPVGFEFMPFFSYYTYEPEDNFSISELTETDELWHYGTEMSLLVFPLPFVKQFMPYLGIGYDFSNLTSNNNTFESNLKTSSAIFKVGFDIYLAKDVIQAEYKRSGFNNISDRNHEFYSNSQFTISILIGSK